jgi:hypothetical protein
MPKVKLELPLAKVEALFVALKLKMEELGYSDWAQNEESRLHSELYSDLEEAIEEANR